MKVEMVGVFRRKRKMIEDLIQVNLNRYRASGAELVMGEARFTEPKTVQVALNSGGTRLLYGDRIFLNVGTRAHVPGLAASEPMTRDAA